MNEDFVKDGGNIDEVKQFGEKILNSDLWVCFTCSDEGAFKYENKQEAMIIVAQYFVDNRQDRKLLINYLKEKLKFSIDENDLMSM